MMMPTATAQSAEQAYAAAAAEVLVPPTTIGIGRVAVVADPQGAVFGIFEGDTDA